MGVATMHTPNGLGPPDLVEKLAHWMDFLGQLLSRNCVFEIFSLNPPPFSDSDIIQLISNLANTLYLKQYCFYYFIQQQSTN